MSAVGAEYATTHKIVDLWTKVPAQPVPVPPSPHGWRLCAATAVLWKIKGGHQVLYTWFWRRAGRERVVGVLGGESP